MSQPVRQRVAQLVVLRRRPVQTFPRDLIEVRDVDPIGDRGYAPPDLQQGLPGGHRSQLHQ